MSIFQLLLIAIGYLGMLRSLWSVDMTENCQTQKNGILYLKEKNMACHNFYFKIGCCTNCCRRVCQTNDLVDSIEVFPNPPVVFFINR